MLNYKALREKEKMLVISNLSLSHTAFLERGGGGGGAGPNRKLRVRDSFMINQGNMGGYGKFSPEVVINSPLPPIKYTTTCTPTQEVGIDLRVQ